MTGRLSLGGRIALILVAALVIVQLAVTAVFYIDRDRATAAGYRLPFADQVAALARLADAAGPDQRAVLLRAVNSPGFRASIRTAPPTEPATAWRLHGQERLVHRYLAEGDTRPVRVIVLGGRRAASDGDRAGEAGLQVRATVGLAGGDVLVVEAGGSLISRVLGIPPGFLASLLGLVIALIALIAVARALRPLNRLADAVSRFGEAPEPRPLAPDGAPEVRALILAINAMQERIAALLRDRSFIIGALAHDLRTYLTRLRLRIELMPEDRRDAAARDVEAMQALVEDALMFAKASFAGRNTAPVDLAAIVRQVVDDRRAAGPPVTLTLPSPAIAVVTGSAPALTRLVANLVDNAVVYGGRADLTLAVTDDSAVLWVEDRGPGIPEAARAMLMEPFRRLETSRSRDHGGSGLGLAIAQAVTQSMGGRIVLADRPGGGARIIVTLPLAAPPDS